MYSFDESGNPLIDSEKAVVVDNILRGRVGGTPSGRFRAFFMDPVSRTIANMHQSLVGQILRPAAEMLMAALLAAKIVTRQYRGLANASQQSMSGELMNVWARLFENLMSRSLKGYTGVAPVGAIGNGEYRILVSFDAALIRYCSMMTTKLTNAGIPVSFMVIKPSSYLTCLDGSNVYCRNTAVLLSIRFMGIRRDDTVNALKVMRQLTALVPHITRFFQNISRRIVSVDGTYGEYSKMNIVNGWQKLRDNFRVGDYVEAYQASELMHGNRRALFMDRDSFWMMAEKDRHAIVKTVSRHGENAFQWTDPRA